MSGFPFGVRTSGHYCELREVSFAERDLRKGMFLRIVHAGLCAFRLSPCTFCLSVAKNLHFVRHSTTAFIREFHHVINETLRDKRNA
jgi:hypothetical protein